jgi:hypothetical protein
VNNYLFFVLSLLVLSILWQIFLIFFLVPRSSVSLLLSAFKQLSNEIIASLLEPDYIEERYIFERRIHIQKNKCMRAMLRVHAHPCALKSTPFFFTQLNFLFDILLDCAQLRRRIGDDKIIEGCKQDLVALNLALDKAWLAMIKGQLSKLKSNLRVLKWQIDRLEEVYQHVLQVTAHDPLVFFLFIAHLKFLHTEMENAICFIKH